jgi:outer membrane protein assembly factor BamB
VRSPVVDLRAGVHHDGEQVQACAVEEADMDGIRARRVVLAVIAGLLTAKVAPAAGWAVARVRADALSMTGFSPMSGHVGTSVTIDGTGFVAGDVVRFNGTAASKATVAKGGTELHTSVPPLATSGPITVSDPTTGQTVGLPGTAFQVTTGLSALPKRVWAGGALTVSGSGLSPDHNEEILLGKTHLGSVVIDRNGDFQFGTEVPFDEHPGRLGVSVLDPNVGKVVAIIFVLGAWPMYRHDAAHTGYDNFETSISESNVSGLKQLWTKSTDPGGYFGMVPSVSDGLVYEGMNRYATSECGTFYAFTTDGKKNPWHDNQPCGDRLGPAPAEDGGFLFYVKSAGLLHDFVSDRNAATGQVQWDVSHNSDANPVRSAPNVANGRLFVGSGDGNLYAIDTVTSLPLWSFPTGGPVHSSPAVAGGIVYVGSDSGTLFAIKATTGKKVWSANFGGPVESSPAVSGGVVYVGADDGSVAAFDAATGAPVWSRAFKNRVFRTAPAVANGVVYIGGDKGTNGTLFALDATSGATNWSFVSSSGVTDAAVANGVVYVGVGALNTVYGIDATTGFAVWNVNVASAPLAPIVANGEVYVEGGSTIWAFGL